ncbi:MAG: hypothetical protein ACLQU4_21935 [Limisphaerales bacterium]
MEAVATRYGYNAEGGSKNFNFSTQETHSDLHDYIILERGVLHPSDGFFLRAESFYNVATEIDRLGVERAYEGGGHCTGNHMAKRFISKILYTETEHYQVMKDFLNRRERMLDLLLSAEDADLESKRRKD